MTEHGRILGIDPGSLRCGFGVVARVDGGIAHIAHGTIILDPKKPVSERLRDLAVDMAHIIDKYAPTHAAVEDVFFFKNPRSALVLGQARGAVLASLGLRGVAVESLAPTAIKALIAGRGRAQKFQVAHMVSLQLGIAIPQSKDASDALAIALAYAFSSVRLENPR